MDLNFSEKHRAFQAEVREFIRRHGPESPKTGGGRKRPDRKTLEWQRLLIEHGYAARTIPREYGGYGAAPDVLEAAIIAEEFSRANVHPGIMNQGISMLVPTLLEVGTREQCERWVRPTIRGEIIWCQGYSEPEAGSDLASVRTRAVVADGHFVVNGHKIWTSSAHYADMMFLLCRTEPDRPKHEGLSYLLLSMRTPGVEVRPLRTMTGRAEFNEVFFTDVRVPLDQIVMGRGQGWHVANITLKHERMGIGDAGKLMHRLQRLVELLRATEVDGVPLIAAGEFRSRLLRLQGEVLAWRAHNLRLLTDQARGEDSGLRRLIVKYGGTVLGHRLSALAVDALGTEGLTALSKGEDAQDDDAANWNNDYLYDIGLLIGGGTSNIQRNIIGERGLGLPREPKVQVAGARGG
jgi:alkylation response protein AidB-like acyl-CoA dehydrogenase